jgi:hypothetical protein
VSSDTVDHAVKLIQHGLCVREMSFLCTAAVACGGIHPSVLFLSRKQVKILRETRSNFNSITLSTLSLRQHYLYFVIAREQILSSSEYCDPPSIGISSSCNHSPDSISTTRHLLDSPWYSSSRQPAVNIPSTWEKTSTRTRI